MARVEEHEMHNVYNDDVRKLWNYPFDLSEERLLALIDNPPTGGTDGP